MASTLVIALARLGDVVQCFPAISDLDRQNEGKGVDVIAQKSLATLVKLHPAVRHVIEFDGDVLINLTQKNSGWFVAGLDSLNELCAQIEELEPGIIVNLTHSRLSGVLGGVLSAEAKRGRFIGRNGREEINTAWARYFFALLESRTANGFNLVDIFRRIAVDEPENLTGFRFKLNAERKDGYLPYAGGNRKRIALATGAHHPLRRWEIKAWVETLQILFLRHDLEVVLLGGTEEQDNAEIIKQRFPERTINLCGKTNFKELTGVISECDLFLGLDSGSLHLAALAGIPCVGLYFAMASAWETAPYSDKAMTIEADLPCHPCNEQSVCGSLLCHHAVKPELVADCVSELLTGVQLSSWVSAVVKHTGFDQKGRLNLQGYFKPGDDLRQLWRWLIPDLLSSLTGTSITSQTEACSRMKYFREEFSHFNKALLTRLTTLLNRVSVDSITSLDANPVAMELLELRMQYPSFRPLLDLFKVDFIASGAAGLPSAEQSLRAQDKLIQRIVAVEARLMTSQQQSGSITLPVLQPLQVWN